ncbi:MAG: carbonic anhydrase [Woeseiaceae bacterium]
MDDIKALFDRNRTWAEELDSSDPGFFSRLAEGQTPQFLWIGCSDSRVPANQITGLMPGDVFVHRNVANVVSATDPNCMAAVEYAVLSLQVRHIIVCGHYGCGGVLAALGGYSDGVVGGWLGPIRELAQAHQEDLSKLDDAAAARRLCELNVLHQVKSLCESAAPMEAWAHGQELHVHGWIYGIEDGLLRSLEGPISAPPEN